MARTGDMVENKNYIADNHRGAAARLVQAARQMNAAVEVVAGTKVKVFAPALVDLADARAIVEELGMAIAETMAILDALPTTNVRVHRDDAPVGSS